MKAALPFTAVVAAVVAAGAPVACGATITDGDFSNWGLSTIHVQAGGTVSIERLPGGGNPDACLQITDDAQSYHVYGVAIKDDFTWNPAVDGGFATVRMRLQSKPLAGNTGFMLVLQQGGKYYGQLGAGLENHSTDWASFETAYLSGSQLGEWGALQWTGQPCDASSNPNFSPAGAPIKFGFVASNSFSGYATELFDNWEIEINVPEPGALALLGMGGVVLARYRRSGPR